jgi:hypothetical protein
VRPRRRPDDKVANALKEGVVALAARCGVAGEVMGRLVDGRIEAGKMLLRP